MRAMHCQACSRKGSRHVGLAEPGRACLCSDGRASGMRQWHASGAWHASVALCRSDVCIMNCEDVTHRRSVNAQKLGYQPLRPMPARWPNRQPDNWSGSGLWHGSCAPPLARKGVRRGALWAAQGRGGERRTAMLRHILASCGAPCCFARVAVLPCEIFVARSWNDVYTKHL